MDLLKKLYKIVNEHDATIRIDMADNRIIFNVYKDGYCNNFAIDAFDILQGSELFTSKYIEYEIEKCIASIDEHIEKYGGIEMEE